jgi:hypothetical protein
VFATACDVPASSSVTGHSDPEKRDAEFAEKFARRGG